MPGHKDNMRTLRLLAALVAMLAIASLPLAAQAQLSVAIAIGAPPPIPVYAVPPPPAPNYIWEPGYWAWGPYGYYWVPGTWVLAPDPALYWTPGYWNWNGVGFIWIGGYWATQVGFYGGIDYGGGYFGNGYIGGYWNHNVFVYNTYIVNADPRVVDGHVYRHAYARYWLHHPYTSYDGGRGGLQYHPTAAQVAIAHSRHWGMTAAQTEHARVAAQNRNYLANVNHGRPSDPEVTHPFTPTSHPGFAAITARDHATAQARIHPTSHQVTTVTHAAPVHHNAAAYRMPSHAAAPAYHPTHAAPAQHAAPQHAAPRRAPDDHTRQGS